MQTESSPNANLGSTCRLTSQLKQRTQIYLLCNEANERREAGRYSEAESLYLRALALAEQVSGPREVAIICNSLAVVYKYTGKFDDAERLYRRALPLLEQSLGPQHPQIAAIYHNLGGLEHARGRFAAGEPLARRSVEIREQALGPNHPEVAADIAALAAILDGQGKYDESEPLYSRALAIFEREYGPEHYGWSFLKADTLEDCAVPWVGTDAVKSWIGNKISESNGLICERFIKPLEAFVFIAKSGIDLGKIEWANITLFGFLERVSQIISREAFRSGLRKDSFLTRKFVRVVPIPLFEGLLIQASIQVNPGKSLMRHVEVCIQLNRFQELLFSFLETPGQTENVAHILVDDER